MSVTSKSRERREFFGGLFGTALVAIILGLLCYSYWKDINITATSREIEVMVTGKKPGSGKTDPRKVYVQDRGIPVAITTTARWYFEAIPGQKTKVRFSEKYHAYQQPYHREGKLKSLIIYITIVFAAMIGRIVWLYHYIWLQK